MKIMKKDNSTMEKDFLNLELSREITSLGLVETCYGVYYQLMEYSPPGLSTKFNEGSPVVLLKNETIITPNHYKFLSVAVLYQQALDFLDGLGYSISTEHIDNSRTNHWEYTYRDSHDRDYNDEDLMDSSKLKWNTNKYKSRQEAWEAGIKRVLKQIKKEKYES